MPSIDASDREIIPEFLEAMREEGFPPQFIYAYKKTGYILLSDPEQNLPEGAEEMWHAAIKEYFLLESRAGGRQAN
ncbi:MAG: hypothetical protein ACLQF1_14935 [Methyloceanibacter sp.]